MRSWHLGLIAIAFSSCGLAKETHPSDLFEAHGLVKQPGLSNLERKYFGPDYYVSTVDDQLIISQDPPAQYTNKIELEGISYSGMDGGEWGGELIAEYSDGRKVVLLDENVRQLIPFGSQLYVMTGLSHMLSSWGAIYRVPDAANPTTPNLVTLLPDAPQVVYLDSSRPDSPMLVVVSMNGIIIMELFGHDARVPDMDILVWNAFWSSKMTATSVARHGDHYYIGLPHGVAVVSAFDPGEVAYYADSEFKR